MHVDSDYFYTTLSCFSTEENPSEEVLYHFSFPEYELAIPMRHGDVLLFDPRVKHCATNPHVMNSLIVSAYVSKRTIISHVNSEIREHTRLCQKSQTCEQKL